MKNIFEQDENSTKSDILKFLKNNIQFSKIEKLIDFKVSDWNKDNSQIIKIIQNEFTNGQIIVRSSAIGEDSSFSSQAGKYDSVLNINPKSKLQIKNSINKVIQSYIKNNNSNLENKILIQQQSDDIITSGVIFTRSEPAGAPYYTINYDVGTTTDSVTSGKTTNTIKIFRKINNKKLTKKWKLLLRSVKEIENILNSDLLDIEFGISKKHVKIFQVRPITIIPKQNFKKIDKQIQNIILKNQIYFEKLGKSNSQFGTKIAFSDMSDWNPSEIIGNNPNRLDYSLYFELIMKNIWTKGRSAIGYNEINNYPLMFQFGNKPYVDLRASFNSLIPNNIPKKIQKKLLKHFFNKLQLFPFLHDKIEFEIVFTCYDFLFEKRKKELIKSEFSKKEINEFEKQLIIFTSNLIKNFPSNSKKLHKSLNHLAANQKEINEKIKKKPDDFKTLINSIGLLLDDCKTFGTKPFSTMARYAFVGNILLQSLMHSKKISQDNYNNFMDSIKTPLTDYKNDMELFSKSKITKNTFMRKYGHLRPGTYDITIPRYDSNSEFFEHFVIKSSKSKSKHNLKFLKNINTDILDISLSDFLNFVISTITNREIIKFEFTKTLSDLIENIAKAGIILNFSRYDMAHLSMSDICRAKTMSKAEIKLFWKKQILKEKRRRQILDFLILPPLIFDKKDFEIIEYYVSRPNYITNKKISGNIIKLDSLKKIPNLENKIILIENADPGYDWIFTKNPSALITKYGGLASHMAIRCAEVKLPAAIGCGELLFEKLLDSDKVLLDCHNQQITILENKTPNPENDAKKILKLLGYIK